MPEYQFTHYDENNNILERGEGEAKWYGGVARHISKFPNGSTKYWHYRDLNTSRYERKVELRPNNGSKRLVIERIG